MTTFRDRTERVLRPRRGMISTAFKLILACVVVGFLLGALGIDPIGLWVGLWTTASNGIRDALDLGTGWVAVVLAALATGAVVVVPLWLLKRLLGGGRR